MSALGTTSQLFSTPYLTLAEYKNAPTAVDCDNLVPGGTSTQNDAELANVIARASSWVDATCRQVIAATTDVEQFTARVRRDGTLRLHPRFFPIRMIVACAFGYTTDALSVLTPDATWWVEQSRLVIPAAAIGGATFTTTFPQPRPVSGEVFVNLTYVNGYPNTILTANVTAATALPVTDATGVLPGDRLGVYDDMNGIQLVTVANTWTPTVGAQAVPVTTAVTANSGVSVSGLPPAVKQAAIHAVTGLLKARGATSLTARVVTTPGGTVIQDAGASYDFRLARELLAPFTRVR